MPNTEDSFGVLSERVILNYLFDLKNNRETMETSIASHIEDEEVTARDLCLEKFAPLNGVTDNTVDLSRVKQEVRSCDGVDDMNGFNSGKAESEISADEYELDAKDVKPNIETIAEIKQEAESYSDKEESFTDADARTNFTQEDFKHEIKDDSVVDSNESDPLLAFCFSQPTRRSSRKRTFHETSGKASECPICKGMFKKDELAMHIQNEVSRLDNLLPRLPSKTDDARKRKSSSHRKRTTTDEEEPMTHQERQQTYLRIKHAREKRREKEKQQKTNCPVCQRLIQGSDEELSQHVNKCLNGEAELGDDDDDVDVDGYEEYTWAGMTRVRATTMYGGGLSDLGHVAVRRPGDEDTESDLDVDGDASDVYGTVQYGESDLLITPPEEEEDSSAVRDVMLGETSRSQSSSEADRLSQACGSPEPSPSTSSPQKPGTESSSVIASLRAHIRELEKNRDQKMRCLVCMDPYKCPVVSVQCWHVYCEDCWLRILGAKKLCPQCNMITSPVDLRRIFL